MSKFSSGGGADEPATEMFTAVSILNREGHPPGTADRAAQPQHGRDADPDPGAEPDKPGRTRRGAIAGGAGLAGGVAVGVAAFAGGSEPTPGEMVPVAAGGAEDTYPGQGLLDIEEPTEAPLEPVAIDPAANTGPIDDPQPVASAGGPVGTPAAAAPPSPEPAAPAAAPDDAGHDTDFGSGSDHRASDDDSSEGDSGDSDPSDGDPGGGDPGGGDEGGLLGAGSEGGVLDTGLLASDSGSDSSDDESESSDGGDDGGGVLGTGLLG